MIKPMKISLIRNYNFSNLIENFIFSSVITILGIRVFLEITGYPQLGSSSGLHVAHMLWGGLFMLVTIIVFLAVLNRSALVWGSILGGIGFGFFIDELGKFVTTDNNYFFKPTFAMIYGIFITIYLASKLIEKIPRSNKEKTINAIEIVQQGYISGFTNADIKNLNNLLLETEESPLTLVLKTLVKDQKTVEQDENIIIRIKNFLYRKYIHFISRKWFQNTLIFIFGLSGLVGFLGMLGLISGQVNTFENTFLIITNFISILLMIIGIFYLLIKKNHLRTYELFRYSVLITIFFNQFSLFYQDQLVAILSLFTNITLYLVLRYLIAQEKRVIV